GVKQFLKGRGEDAIAVGAFSGPAQMPSSAGPGIVKILTEELEREGIRVKLRSRLGLIGVYRAVEMERGRGLKAVLKARVEDQTGKVLVEFEKTTYDQATLAALFGLTFQRPSPGPGGVEDGRVVERALVDSFA